MFAAHALRSSRQQATADSLRPTDAGLARTDGRRAMTFPDAMPALALQWRNSEPPTVGLSPRAVSWLQVAPLALILLIFFVLPTGLFVVVSFFDYDRTGIYPAFIFDNYQDLLASPATLRLYGSTLKFAVIVWAITLFLGFNIAYFLIFHVRSSAIRVAFFLLCAVPFLTSAIIRTIAWIPFLGRNGAFNQTLMKLQVTSQPLDFLLFSDFAVIVAYVYLYTVLMIGPIANSLAKIDRSLLEAARDAGASR
jgi:putative spermidine/putrescine transport system permease protein